MESPAYYLYPTQLVCCWNWVFQNPMTRKIHCNSYVQVTQVPWSNALLQKFQVDFPLHDETSIAQQHSAQELHPLSVHHVKRGGHQLVHKAIHFAANLHASMFARGKVAKMVGIVQGAICAYSPSVVQSTASISNVDSKHTLLRPPCLHLELLHRLIWELHGKSRMKVPVKSRSEDNILRQFCSASTPYHMCDGTSIIGLLPDHLKG